MHVRDLLSANDFRFNDCRCGYGQIRTGACHCVVGDVNVGEYLIEKNLAVRYDGGTKTIIDWDNPLT